MRKNRTDKSFLKNDIRLLKPLAASMLACNILFFGSILAGNSLPANIAIAAAKAPVPTNKPKPSVADPGQKSVGLPQRLRIDSIGVNALIEAVGIGSDGAMGTPKIPRNVAWYKLGPKPGEVGSAVIAGHVNWWTGAASAFAKLSRLKPGDKITVQDVNGATAAFTVKRVARYGASVDSTGVFFSSDGKSHLNLVTCIGVWDKRARQYSQRLVVFADKIE